MAEWKKVIVSGSRAELQDASGSFSGSFEGDGSGLTNVPASGVVGLSLDQIATTNVTASVSEGADSFKLVSGSETPFKIGNDGVMTGTGSGLIDLKATETDLQAQILSNQNVGGVSSGTTFTSGTNIEDILNQILVSYIQPTINLDHVRNSGTNITTPREVGDEFTINQIQYDATADDPNGNLIQDVGFASTNAATNFQLNLGANPLSAGNNQILSIATQTINRTSAGTVTFTISGSDLNDAVVSDTKNIIYRVLTVFGGSSTDLNNSSQQSTDVQTIYNAIKSQRSSLTATTADFSTTGTTATDNDSNYTYYMYNASYNDLAEYTQAGFTNSIGGAYTKIGTTFTVTNDQGQSVSLKVYQSNGTQAVNNNQAIVFID